MLSEQEKRAAAKRLERNKEFRERIFDVATEALTQVSRTAIMDDNGQIVIAEAGCWVPIKLWLCKAEVLEWQDEVENPPSSGELLEALQDILKAATGVPSIPHYKIRDGMGLVARAQGKSNWMDAKL